MKKQTLALAMIAVAVALGACSPKKETLETTTAVETTTASETTTAAETTVDPAKESTEEVVEDYAAGTIVKVEGNTLTIQDEFEEIEKTFDISDASIIKLFPLTVGDYVEVVFPEGAAGDVVEALKVEVLEAVLAESEDPMMIGTITEAGGGTLTIEDGNGESYSFTTINAYEVSGDGGLVEGTEVQVTYLGELDDESLMAIKIVTEDKYDSKEAALNAFVGDVDSAKKGILVLISESEDYLTFTSAKLDFTKFKEGDTVKVTYEGSISAKEIPATAVEAN